MVEDTNYATSTTTREAPMMLLRPKPARTTMLEAAQICREDSHDAELDTYRLLHAGKTADLFNEAMQGHQLFKPGCEGRLTWFQAGEVQRGLCWREQLTCMTCKYISPRRKLYKDVESKRRGPKAASANLGAQVGMAHTGVSNTGLCRILLSTNTPAPSKTSMQASANKVGKSIIQANQKDMAQIKKDLKVVTRARGLSERTGIDVEVDCRYSNPIHSGVGVTPFQPATQVTQLVAENVTNTKKIIHITNKSKLCRMCKSPGGKKKHDCTANLQPDQSIGNEKQWTRESLSALREDGLSVNTITTDADGSAFSAAEEMFLAGETATPPKHQLDTRHVTSNQRKFVKNTDFSYAMFGVKTVQKKKQLTSRLASDLSARCHAEHMAAMEHYRGDAGRVSSKMPHVKNAIIKCYHGQHQFCRKNSFVCRGLISDNWLMSSSYLSKGFKLDKPTTTDLETLKLSIEKRLGQSILNKTKYLLNTQKCEAANRAITSTVPRHMTFSRNYEARVHAAIHSVNSGIGESILSECDMSGASLTPGTRVTRRLLKIQNSDIKSKSSKKSRATKKSRKMKRASLYDLHSKKPEKKDIYVKNRTMPPQNDHSYCKV